MLDEPAGAVITTTVQLVPSQRLTSGATLGFVVWPRAKQNVVVGHEICSSWLWDPPSGGAEIDHAVPFQRSVNENRLAVAGGPKEPTAKHAALLVQAMSPKPLNRPAVGCVCVVQLVPFQLWIHVRAPESGSWLPAAKQLVLLTHEMSFASPEPAAGDARATSDQALPFHRRANGCGLPFDIG